MPTDKELMQQALDALSGIPEDVEGYLPDSLTDVTIALRTRLAQIDLATHSADSAELFCKPELVKWRALTDEDIEAAYQEGTGFPLTWRTDVLQHTHRNGNLDFARAIEAKLREKNG